MGFIKHTAAETDARIRCTPRRVDWLLFKGGELSGRDLVEIDFGECAVVARGHDVIDLCSSPGTYLYESDSKELVLFFINMKEQKGGDFLAEGIKFIDDSQKPIHMDCRGKFNFAVADPRLFFGSLWSMLSDSVCSIDLANKLQVEISGAMQSVFNKLAAAGINHMTLPEHTPELISATKGSLSLEWGMMRGIELRYLSLSTVERFHDPLNEEATEPCKGDGAPRGEGSANPSVDAAANQIVNGFVNLFDAILKDCDKSFSELSQLFTKSSEDDSEK